VPELECLVYPAHRVRRPVPEVKAIRRAVEMIRVWPRGCRQAAWTPPCAVQSCGLSTLCSRPGASMRRLALAVAPLRSSDSWAAHIPRMLRKLADALIAAVCCMTRSLLSGMQAGNRPESCGRSAACAGLNQA